jgi:cephalosporin hydroxylase
MSLLDGRACIKFDEDLMVYRRIIKESQPEVIVETGSWQGGSAAWFSQFAPVISVDRYAPPPLPKVTFVQGDSIDALPYVEALVAGRSCMVTLDSDHNAAHVLAELNAYAPLATEWLVVEDTFADDPDLYPLGGPGKALDYWLPLHPEWARAKDYEAKGETQNPGGWLRRV